MSRAWQELVEAAGLFGAEMIVRAATKQIRDIGARPGGTGQFEIEIHVARGAVQKVFRIERHPETGPPIAST